MRFSARLLALGMRVGYYIVVSLIAAKQASSATPRVSFTALQQLGQLSLQNRARVRKADDQQAKRFPLDFFNAYAVENPTPYKSSIDNVQRTFLYVEGSFSHSLA